MLEIERLDIGFVVRNIGVTRKYTVPATDKYAAAGKALAWLGFPHIAIQRALVVLGNEQKKPVEDKYLDLLDYLMNRPHPWMGWVGVPAAFTFELLLDACAEGLIESFSESETYQITQAGIDRSRVGRRS